MGLGANGKIVFFDFALSWRRGSWLAWFIGLISSHATSVKAWVKELNADFESRL